ncbi:YqhR family membrane protein [Lentibacillus sp. L22]|uniref:YqhR family membrane protein n=1 Tax=Lentibacillus TaxID=175304 RepID=UPI0022B15306|nr:YqhR family membrane protein [Lentibacillus daqui]
MAEKKPNQASSQQVKPVSILPRSLFTGFIGGLIWSICGVLLYYFNFAEVSPKTFELRSWLKTEWTDSWLGDVISILGAGILSILAAFIYYGLFKRIRPWWFGAVYGIILWVIIFYVLHPIFGDVPSLAEMNMHTIVSTVCLFILYGTFIGYSISYDYYDTVVKVWKDRK